MMDAAKEVGLQISTDSAPVTEEPKKPASGFSFSVNRPRSWRGWPVVQLVESSVCNAVCSFTEGCGLIARSNRLALVVTGGEPSFRIPLMYPVRLPMFESITYCWEVVSAESRAS
jgi:hypothetical protein